MLRAATWPAVRFSVWASGSRVRRREFDGGHQALAVMLATDAVYRDSCGERVRRQMEHGSVFLEARACAGRLASG